MKPPLMRGSPDEYQTPPHALEPLMPHLDSRWHIWEPACGKGNIVQVLTDGGWMVTGTDILGGVNFCEWQPTGWDAIVTNPPYRYKQEFLERAYALGKPFAFLMPLTTLETEKRQRLFRDNGLELILMPKRVNFETPSGNGRGAWFATAWFTWGLNIGRGMTFWRSL